jgi:hypothetical protein
METVQWVFDYLTGVQFHPFVTIALFFLVFLGIQRWAEPWVAIARQAIADAAKCQPGKQADDYMMTKVEAQKHADRNSNYVLFGTWLLSVMAEFAMYWPTSNQARFICFFMSFAQVGAAWFVYYCFDKWGVADWLGQFIHKKIDQRVA